MLYFLTNRPQSVKMADFASSTWTLSAGNPEGNGLSPLFYSLLIHICVPIHNTNTSLRVTKNNWKVYREEVRHLATWCFTNSLLINTQETNKLTTGPGTTTFLSTSIALECVTDFGGPHYWGFLKDIQHNLYGDGGPNNSCISSRRWRRPNSLRRSWSSFTRAPLTGFSHLVLQHIIATVQSQTGKSSLCLYTLYIPFVIVSFYYLLFYYCIIISYYSILNLWNQFSGSNYSPHYMCASVYYNGKKNWPKL